MSQHVEKEGISYFNYCGLLILAVCYLGALWNVFKIKKDTLIEHKKVIRICHWQLELGFRDAMEAVIEKFEKRFPEYKVVQIPVTERAYGQWVTTQLIGRTAPDLIELGMFNVTEYLGRYFTPLTSVLRKPNPFNKDNPRLKDVAWMDTFKDGLQSSYIPELIDYYGVGVSMFTVRIFYNKDAFREILGTDQPPKSLQQFLDYCDRIQKYVKKQNAEIEQYNLKHKDKPLSKIVFFPIASASNQVRIFRRRYNCMFTSDEYLKMDEGCDGGWKDADFYAALMKGKLTLDNEKYKISCKFICKLASYFPPGFMAIGRMDSGFAFVQRRAAMITSGSWDASSFIKQINEQPFGDIIEAINGEKITSLKQAEGRLIALASSGKKVNLKINREGGRWTISLMPKKGNNLMDCYGMKLGEFENSKGTPVVVITKIREYSPAYEADLHIRKRFEVGICDFPVPRKDNPVYGKYVVGPAAEQTYTGASFGLIKFSKHKDVAIKFLQFLTTPENNELFNSICQWIPAVIDTKPVRFLEAFKPNYKGYWGSLSFYDPSYRNSRCRMRESQVFWPFVSGEIDYDGYKAMLGKSLPENAARDYITYLRASGEMIPDKQLIRSRFLAAYVFSDNEERKKYNRFKLRAGWDVVMNFGLRRPIIDAQMGKLIKKPPTEFAKKFVEYYIQLKSKEQ